MHEEKAMLLTVLEIKPAVAVIVNTPSLLKDKLEGGQLYVTFRAKCDELSMTIPYLQ